MEGVSKPVSGPVHELYRTERCDRKDDHSTESFMSQLRRMMGRIIRCNELACDSCAKNINSVNEMLLKIYLNVDVDIPWKTKLAVSRQMISLGALEMFEPLWNQFFPKKFLSNPNCYTMLFGLSYIVMNLTDGNREASQAVLDMNLHAGIVRYLSSGYLDLNDYDLLRIYYALIGIIYNIVQETSDARELVREVGIVPALQRFRNNCHDAQYVSREVGIAPALQRFRNNCHDAQYVSRSALITQAWVINDKEIDLILDGDVFDFLVQALQSSIDTGYRPYNGYRPIELLKAVNKLIVNDDNKVASVKAGILPIYVRILTSAEAQLTNEKLAAIEGIWMLSDHCADAIKRDTSCTKVLETISTNSNSDYDLKRNAREILKQLGILKENFTKSCTPTSGECKARMIFISYAHQISVETVSKIKERLQSVGYSVWIDTEQISGDIDEDIIRGIASSSIFIACLSHRYYERPACKSELKRARNLGKEVIPVIVEKKYQPEGWLEFCLPDRFWIDFSDESNLDHSFKLLFRQIKKTFENPTEVHMRIEQTSTQIQVNDDHPSPLETQHTPDSCSSWTSGQVTDWLEENDLTSFRFILADYDGKLLVALKKFSQKVPAVFAAHLKKNRFSLADLTKLEIALQELQV